MSTLLILETGFSLSANTLFIAIEWSDLQRAMKAKRINRSGIEIDLIIRQYESTQTRLRSLLNCLRTNLENVAVLNARATYIVTELFDLLDFSHQLNAHPPHIQAADGQRLV
jgi:hypothetical protein